MTRSQFVFWPLLAGVATAAIMRGGRLTYQLLYIICGVLAVSLFFSIAVSLAVRVKTEIPVEFITTGQSVRWMAVIKNRLLLPVPVIKLRFFRHKTMLGKDTDTVALRPRQTINFEVEHVYTCRGIYKTGVHKWRAPDYFALLCAFGRVRKTPTASVLPRIIALDDVDGGRPHVESSEFSHMAQPEFDGIRPYENTDPLRSVHWKLSSKTDELVVKKTRGTIPTPVHVLIDMTPVPCEKDARAFREDKLLETALSLIRHLLSGGPVDVTVITGASKHQAIRSLPEFNWFYQEIGLAPFEGGVPDEQTASLEINPQAMLWMVSSHGGAAIVDLMRTQVDYGGTSYWIYIPGGSECTPDETALLDNAVKQGILAAPLLPVQDIRELSWMFN